MITNRISIGSTTPRSSRKGLRRPYATVLLLGSISMLAACSGADHADLDAYIAQVKSRKPGRIAPLPEFQTYESYIYAVQSLRSPFDLDSGSTIGSPIVEGTGLRPDANRHKEALEAFPLDTLKFSGQLERGTQRWAIITAPDELVYRVQEGNYIGQNHGRIHTVTESKISLTELIQDGLGNWVERESSLALTE